MIVSYNGFCFSQRSEPPLNFKIFISSNAFDNSTFFYEQPKFTWLVRVVIAVKVSGEIDAPSSSAGDQDRHGPPSTGIPGINPTGGALVAALLAELFIRARRRQAALLGPICSAISGAFAAMQLDRITDDRHR